jgi:uncharacterized protein YecA (UPF0149 family)
MRDVRDALVPACTLMGQSFPELEEWRKAIEEEKEEVRRRQQAWQQRPLPGTAPRRVLAPAPPPPRPPAPAMRVGNKVGRNDPCPCGSGKKFKKCCINKQGPF